MWFLERMKNISAFSLLLSLFFAVLERFFLADHSRSAASKNLAL